MSDDLRSRLDALDKAASRYREPWTCHADKKIGGGFLFSVYQADGQRLVHNIPKQLAELIVAMFNAGRQVPMLGRTLLAEQELQDHEAECDRCWSDSEGSCPERQELRMEAFGQRTTALAELAKALERS